MKPASIQTVKGIFALFFCLVISFTGRAQQRVFVNFNVPVLTEEFDQVSKTWPEIRSAENIFVFDEGDYFLIRNNPVTPYAVMANWPNKVEEFHLKTSLKMGPASSKSQTIGIILMASDDGSNGLIIEFNRSKDYRIKTIEGDGFRYLTPDGDDDGWEGSFALNGPGKENILEVKTQNGEFDLFFNDKYITSFSAHNLFSGNFGILIGPDTKARVDYYRVFSTRDAKEFTSIDGRNYAEMVKELTQENIRLRNEIQDQKAVIAEFADGGALGKIQALESIIENLEVELEQANRERTEYRARLEDGGRGIDPELSSFLGETVQNLLETNQRLSNAVQSLEAENEKLRGNLEDLTLRFLTYSKETELKMAEYRRAKRGRLAEEPVLSQKDTSPNMPSEPAVVPETVNIWSDIMVEVNPDVVWESKKPVGNYLPTKTQNQ